MSAFNSIVSGLSLTMTSDLPFIESSKACVLLMTIHLKVFQARLHTCKGNLLELEYEVLSTYQMYCFNKLAWLREVG